MPIDEAIFTATKYWYYMGPYTNRFRFMLNFDLWSKYHYCIWDWCWNGKLSHARKPTRAEDIHPRAVFNIKLCCRATTTRPQSVGHHSAPCIVLDEGVALISTQGCDWERCNLARAHGVSPFQLMNNSWTIPTLTSTCFMLRGRAPSLCHLNVLVPVDQEHRKDE